ncbi:MAG: N-acetyltransferase [Thermodesulfobacteriota bacterium]
MIMERGIAPAVGTVRKAVIKDVGAICSLVDDFARRGVMLPRTSDDVTRSIREFHVYADDGEVLGVAALAICLADMGEVRSLAVAEGSTGRGIGSALVRACLDEAAALGLARVFALTYQAGFFRKLGFQEIEKTELPHKIWGDCVKCCKFPSCDETAMMIGLG